VQTPDVLAGLVVARADPRQVLVGFAAETAADPASLLELGQAKLARKGCDLLVLNEVGPGLVFGQQDSEITILGGPDPVGPLTGSKDTLAHRIWDETLAVRSRR
jgi:phosphopantothenoylcysteine decarboxylase / phosphopantothenate---cysteine ligase